MHSLRQHRATHQARFCTALITLVATLIACSLVAGPADAAKPPQGKPPQTKPQQGQPAHAGFQPVTICHATGSSTNPFVTITIDNQGELNGHRPHAGDRIPAPAGGCAGSTPVDACPDLEGFQADTTACPVRVDACPDLEGFQADTTACTVQVDACPDLEGFQADTTACPAPVIADACPDVQGNQTNTTSCPETAVLNAGDNGTASPNDAQGGEVATANEVGPAAAPQQTAVAGQANAGAQLPFTGGPTELIALLGLLALLGGTALHVTTRRRELAQDVAP